MGWQKQGGFIKLDWDALNSVYSPLQVILEHLQVLSEEVREKILFDILGRWCPPGSYWSISVEVAQNTAQTSWLDRSSWLALELAEVRCCQCSCSFPLSWLQVLAKVICISQPCPAMHGIRDALVVQPFTCAK